MKGFLFQVAKFSLLQAVIAVVVLGSAHLHFREGYLASLEDKVSLLESEGPPRILFVGGSSVAFGVDSEKFESSQRKPINLGLNASLGLDFSCSLAESHARSGDLVVLIPEHSNLLEKMKPQPKLQRSLLRQCPRAARYLDDPWPGPKAFLDQRGLPELGAWARTGIGRLPAHIRDTAATTLGAGPKKRLYSRASFNRKNGDMIAHHGMPSQGKPNKAPLSVGNGEKLVLSIERLNRCIAVCRSKGASVVYAFPPIAEPQYAASLKALDEITTALESDLKCPIVTIRNRSVFSLDEFFDKAGHLTEVGKRRNTELLADGLARYETIAESDNAAVIQR